ncbi:MAG: type II secretion system protein [Desulfobulbaceae bacterium]|nr:type II secretion system protein [Desulfobulbaceae bacterium]MCK5545252.1 type II secretion system protein [Desulfobulbaceae bacterium]
MLSLWNTHQSNNKQDGFSLIEILLVIAIMGILAMAIIPRAQRAKTDARYSLVRQAALEIGKWGVEWAERNQESQDVADSCTLNDYMETLTGYTGDGSNNNWSGTPKTLIGTSECRNPSGQAVNYSVADIMPNDKQPRNPFNGTGYMSLSNDGSGSVTPGLLYLARDTNGTHDEYYFVYTGTDSANNQDFHAGMGSVSSMSLAQLRNGIFVIRLMP